MKILILFLFCLSILSAPVWADNEIPSRAKRLKALEDANLMSEVAGMDELDQDIFYMRAQRKSADELKKLYPKMSSKKLNAFARVVK